MSTEKSQPQIRHRRHTLTALSQAKQDYPKSKWKRRLASVSRWLHIYLSMVSFAILLFFAVTGLTLNHASWSEGVENIVKSKAQLKAGWVNNPDTAKVEKLNVVEYLRNKHGIRGSVSDFRIDDVECSVSFKGPGYFADVFIDRENGSYELTETRMGLVAVMNDLHKGRNSGKAWLNIIDISAIMMTLVSLSGIILVCFIKRKRLSGLLLAGVGLLLCYLVYILFVP